MPNRWHHPPTHPQSTPIYYLYTIFKQILCLVLNLIQIHILSCTSWLCPKEINTYFYFFKLLHVYCPNQQPGLYRWVPQSTCVLSPPATWTIQVGTTEYMCTVPTGNLDYTGGYHRVHVYCPHHQPGLYRSTWILPTISNRDKTGVGPISHEYHSVWTVHTTKP